MWAHCRAVPDVPHHDRQYRNASVATSLGAGRSEQCRLQRGVGHLSRQWAVEPGTCQPFLASTDCRRRNTYLAGSRPWRSSTIVAESLAPGAMTSAIALRYGLHRNQLYSWIAGGGSFGRRRLPMPAFQPANLFHSSRKDRTGYGAATTRSRLAARSCVSHRVSSRCFSAKVLRLLRGMA
jgi:hypothetical protein